MAGSNVAGTQPVTGTLAASGRGAAFKPDPEQDFNVEFSGTWAGTATLDRSLDGGVTWVSVTNLGVAISFTTNISEIAHETEAGAQWSVNFTRSSGALAYRLSQ